MSSKKFQELNLSDSFLFPAALEDPETCRLVIECIIGEIVGELKIKAEYTNLHNAELKCIRLDVYAKDVVTEVSYNLEMQNKNEYNLPLRSRYYQAQLDVGSLKPGDEYKNLKPLYVIFICNFDPFDKELYRYTFSMQCEECEFPLDDGVKRIFFSTKGKNKEDVPKILTDFLGYLNDSTDMYVGQDLDKKVKQIHERIKLLKQDRNVENKYMHYLSVKEAIEAAEKVAEEMKRKAEEEKRKAEEEKRKVEEEKRKVEEAIEIIREMLFDNIAELGDIPRIVRERIEKEENINILKAMNKVAVKVDSMEQYEQQIANL